MYSRYRILIRHHLHALQAFSPILQDVFPHFDAQKSLILMKSNLSVFFFVVVVHVFDVKSKNSLPNMRS